MPAGREAKIRGLAYTSSGFVRRMGDAGNRDTNSMKNVDAREIGFTVT
jgi:hypothetical protein